MSQSSAAVAKTLMTAKQYNDLRLDVLSTTLGHMHDGTLGRVHSDNTIFPLGTDSDIAFVLRSTILATNTALTGVLVGTPVTPAVAANSLIISNVTASGDILLAGNLGGNSRAYLFADVSADTLDLLTAGVSRLFLAAGGLVGINETTNANMTLGLTINQGAADNEILALKSSDVAHGRTGLAETDTYATFIKHSATGGGLEIAAYAESATGRIFNLVARGGQPDTVSSTTAAPMIFVTGIPHDGLNADVNLSAGALVFGVSGWVGGTDRRLFFVDAEGDLHIDGNTGATAVNATVFDEWDDVKLVRAFDHQRTDKVIRSAWDQHVKYGRQDLIRAGILSDPHDGGDPMVNITQLQRLHNGAIWQLGTITMSHEERLEYLERENKALRQELAALRGG